MSKEELIIYAKNKGYLLSFEPVNQIENGYKDLVDAGIYPLISYTSYFTKIGEEDYDCRMMESIDDFSEKSIKDIKKLFDSILKKDKKERKPN